MAEKVFLVEPDMAYKDSFLEMVAEYERSGEEHYFNKYKGSREDFGKYLEKLQNDAGGINLSEDSAPAVTYWLTDAEGKILGVTRVRPSMSTDYVLKYTGNIGYDIAPSQRGKGLGTAILGLSLKKAREFKLDRVLITCDYDNQGSIRVIEKNGGVFEAEVLNEKKSTLIRRYWIRL